MANKNETVSAQQLTDGQARRLEKKKAAAKANAKKKNAKIGSIVAIIVVLMAVAFGITMLVIKLATTTQASANYSKGLTNDGYIKGIENIADYVDTVDYMLLEVNADDVAYTDDEVQQEIDALVAEYSDADEDGNEITPAFDDEFAVTQLGMSADEYRQKLKEEGQDAKLEEYIENLLTASTAKQIPAKYLKNVKAYLKNNDVSMYNYYNQLGLQYYGQNMYNKFSDMTGQTTEEYEAALAERAEKQVITNMACQYIFEKAGLTITDSDYKAFVAEVGEEAESQYGKGYVMQSLMHEKVVDLLMENARIR